jgi:hypothetical protein
MLLAPRFSWMVGWRFILAALITAERVTVWNTPH